MLHYLDDLDSKMEAMRAQFEREAELDTAWTSYNPSLARPLLNTQKFLDKAASKTEPTSKPATPAADDFGDVVPQEEKASAASSKVERAPVTAESSTTTEEPAASPLDALQRKFESHRITPVGNKTN
jgi:hypothetical protein